MNGIPSNIQYLSPETRAPATSAQLLFVTTSKGVSRSKIMRTNVGSRSYKYLNGSRRWRRIHRFATKRMAHKQAASFQLLDGKRGRCDFDYCGHFAEHADVWHPSHALNELLIFPLLPASSCGSIHSPPIHRKPYVVELHSKKLCTVEIYRSAQTSSLYRARGQFHVSHREIEVEATCVATCARPMNRCSIRNLLGAARLHDP